MKNLDLTKFWIEEVFGGTEMINLLVQEITKANPDIKEGMIPTIQQACTKLFNELSVRFVHKHKPKLPFSDTWTNNASENIKNNSTAIMLLLGFINKFDANNMQQIIEEDYDFEASSSHNDLLLYNMLISHITSPDITYYIRNLILSYVLDINIKDNFLISVMDAVNIADLCQDIYNVIFKNLVNISDELKNILKSIFVAISDFENIPDLIKYFKETLDNLKKHNFTFDDFLHYRKNVSAERFNKLALAIENSEYKELNKIFNINNFINVTTLMQIEKFIIKKFEESLKNKTESSEENRYKVIYNAKHSDIDTLLHDVVKNCYSSGIRTLIAITQMSNYIDMDRAPFDGDYLDKTLYSDTFDNYHDKILDIIKKEITDYIYYLYTIDNFKVIFPDIGEPTELINHLLNLSNFIQNVKINLINFKNVNDIISNFYTIIMNNIIFNSDSILITSFDKKLLFDYYPSYLSADIDISQYEDYNKLVADATKVFKSNYKNYFKMAIKKEYNLDQISNIIIKLISETFKKLRPITSNFLKNNNKITDIIQPIMAMNQNSRNTYDYLFLVIFKIILKNRNYKYENTLNLEIVNVSKIYEDYIEKKTTDYSSILKYIDLDNKEVSAYLEEFLNKIIQNYFNISKNAQAAPRDSDLNLKELVQLMEAHFGMIPEAKTAIMTFKKVLFNIVKEEESFKKTSILPTFVINNLLIKNLMNNNSINKEEILDANIKTIEDLKAYIKEKIINSLNTTLLSLIKYDYDENINFYENLVKDSDLLPSAQVVSFYDNKNKPIKYIYNNGSIQKSEVLSNSFIYSERLAYLFYFILKSLYPSDVKDGAVLNAESDEFCLKMIPDLNKILKITDPKILYDNLTSILSSLIFEYKESDNIKNILRKLCVSTCDNSRYYVQGFYKNPYNEVLSTTARRDSFLFSFIKDDSSKILTCEFKNGKDISEGISEDAESIKLKYLGLIFDENKIKVVPVDNDCNIASFLANTLKTYKISRKDKISLINIIANTVHNIIHQRTDGIKIYINGLFYFRKIDATDWEPYADMNDKVKMLEESINAFLTSIKQKNSKLEIEKINVLTEKMIEILALNFNEKMLNELKTANLGEKIFEVINKIYLAKKSGLNISNYFEIMIKITSEISDSISYNIRIIKSAITYITTFNVLKIYIGYAKENRKVKEIFDPASESADGAFRFRVLKDLDPYHFQVGNDTACCQAIGNAGEAAAVDSYINSTAGVLLLEMKNSEDWILLSQSYFHVVIENSTKKERPAARDYDSPDWDFDEWSSISEYNKKNKGPVKPVEKMIILDNIETAQQAVDLARKAWGGDIIPALYYSLAEYLKAKGWEKILCGKEYTKVIEAKDFNMISIKSDPRHFEIESKGIKNHLKSYISDLKEIIGEKESELIKKLQKERSIILEYEALLEEYYTEDETITDFPDISNLIFDNSDDYDALLRDIDNSEYRNVEDPDNKIYSKELQELYKEIEFLNNRFSNAEAYTDFSAASSYDLTSPIKNFEKIKLEGQSLDKMAANLFIPLIKNAKIRALATELIDIDNYILSAMLNILL